MTDVHVAAVGVMLSSGNFERLLSWRGQSRAAPLGAWAAKASWTSNTSMSEGSNPARFSARAMANAGAMPISWRVEGVGGRR